MYRALLKLPHMLEPPKALSTPLKNSNNLKDITMDNQQETKLSIKNF